MRFFITSRSIFLATFLALFLAVFLAVIVASSSFAFAGIEAGVGTSSFTGGRFVPALNLAYSTEEQAIAWTATGVRNAYYYQASHQLAYYRVWNSGTMWGGNMSSGFGGAVAYTVRSFQDKSSTSEENASDVLVGPAFRMNWSYGFIFLNVSATFGLRDLSRHLFGLTFQDVESFALGVQF